MQSLIVYLLLSFGQRFLSPRALHRAIFSCNCFTYYFILSYWWDYLLDHFFAFTEAKKVGSVCKQS